MTKRYIVLTFLTLATVVPGLFFWGFWKLLLDSNNLALSFDVLIFGLLFISGLALLAFLNDSLPAATAIFLLTGLPVFLNGVSQYTFISFVLVSVAGILLNVRAATFKPSLIKPSVALALSGLGVTITLFSLALTITYFPQAELSSKNFKLKISDQVFNKIYENLAGGLTAENSATESQAMTTAQKYFDSQIPQIRQQLAAQGVTSETQIQEQIDKAREQYLKQVRANLTQAQSPEASLIKSSVESQLNSAIAANRQIIPYILSISLFFSVTFFSSIFSYLILGIVQFAIFILLKTGVLRFESQTIEVKRLTF